MRKFLIFITNQNILVIFPLKKFFFDEKTWQSKNVTYVTDFSVMKHPVQSNRWIWMKMVSKIESKWVLNKHLDTKYTNPTTVRSWYFIVINAIKFMAILA